MQVSSNIIPTKSSIFLPDEIFFYILRFLSPRDVVRLRLVSKRFTNVTRDGRLWRALYINSCLPRPPGPFLWQSTEFLERVLSHSARISQTWTSQPITVVSRTQGPRISTRPSPVSTASNFLFGRLFIWCEGEQLLAQDLETGVGRLLYESTEPISSLSACSLTLPDAERVFIALRHVDTPITDRTAIKLLEFPLQDDVRLTLGPLTFEMDLPECANFPLSCSAHFLYFDGGMDRAFGHRHEPIVIDARTRIIYRFPTFSSSLGEATQWEPRPWWPGFTLLSGEYIFVFRPWHHRYRSKTLIQAFVPASVLVDSSDIDMNQLRLTHEVLVERGYAPTHCLRASIVDPETGETNVRFLSDDFDHGQTHYLCVDITIPPTNPDSTEVLPLSVETQELLVLPGNIRTLFLGVSNDGHGRGITTLSLADPFAPGDNPLVLYKFLVDASSEHCTAVASEPSPLNQFDVFQYRDRCIFDGVRGRLCHHLAGDFNFYDLVVLSLN